MTTLLDLLPDYVLERAISHGAAYQLGRTLHLFGADKTPADLQSRPVSEWLESLEKKYAKRSIAGHRGNLLAIWRWCASRGLCPMPSGVRRCPKPRPRPVAWTADEITRLLAATVQMPDPAWWRMVIETAICSGLRRSDLWRLNAEDMRPDGTIWLEQHKTGWPHVSRVPPDAAKEFARRDGKPLCPSDTRRFYDDFRLLCHLAGVRHGALQMCRRSWATQCEIAAPGSATRYLGHLTATMKEAYVDRSQLPTEPITPPLCWLGALVGLLLVA